VMSFLLFFIGTVLSTIFFTAIFIFFSSYQIISLSLNYPTLNYYDSNCKICLQLDATLYDLLILQKMQLF
jgi:hypothetical protein